MVLNPSMLRMDKAAPGKSGDGSGVVGNPARSTIEYGKQILERQIDAAVKQLTALRAAPRR
jgi:creatinine amidohydrolase/Fe(II)-dependent formamide hydrolase-like protein